MDPPVPPGRDTTYIWEIENFSMCAVIKGEFMKSPSFRVDSMDMSEYRLTLFPRGRVEDPDNTIICGIECLQESRYEINATVCMINEQCQTEKAKQNFLLKTGEVIGFSFPRDWKEFDVEQFSLLASDIFTIRCTVGNACRDPLMYEDLASFSDDMGRLLDSGTFSDLVVLGRDGRRFPVHKAVLAVRCPELAKNLGFLQDETLQTAAMDAVSSDALDAVFRYVYTGKLKNLPFHVMGEVCSLAKGLHMDDLSLDLCPVPTCTTARTVIKVGKCEIVWDLVDFRKRVEAEDWPVKTFLDVVLGRFVASFSIVEDGKLLAQIDLSCVSLTLSYCLLVNCVVLIDNKELCRGEHRFEARDLSKGLTLMGDYGSLYTGQQKYPDRVTLKFDFVLSHPPITDNCRSEKVFSLPNSLSRSLHRLSSDLDMKLRDTSSKGSFHDLWVVSENVESGQASVIPAHKCILAARSEQFRGMIVGNHTVMCQIHIKDVKYDTLVDMLRYLYSAKLQQERDLKSFLELYVAARKYQLESLMRRCLQLVKEKMTMRDELPLVELAYQYDDQKLHDLVDLLRRGRDT